jgi:hypothetical protein
MPGIKAGHDDWRETPNYFVALAPHMAMRADSQRLI